GYGIYKEPNALACFTNMPNGAKKALLNLAKRMPPTLRGRSFIQRGCTPLIDRYVGNAFVFNEEEKENLLKFYDGDTTFKDITHPLFQGYSHLDKISQMQSLDMQTWLRGDILVKSDRLTMAHSLELRVPFLDVEVLEIAKTLTPLEKVTGKTTKHLLRESFKDIVPPHIYKAPKKGYPVPLNKWFCDELYDVIKNLILSPQTEHLINQRYALSLLDSHALNKCNHSRKLFSIITFILWYESWFSKNPV
ncbi:MAG: asparagine synthase-related protein, partial [Turicibacter sp.]